MVEPTTSHTENIRPFATPALIDPEIEYAGDCIICGHSYRDAINAAAADYLEQTYYTGEPVEQRIAKREAFLQGIRSKAVLTLRRGVSQVATCDGNRYEVYCGAPTKSNNTGTAATPPLLE